MATPLATSWPHPNAVIVRVWLPYHIKKDKTREYCCVHSTGGVEDSVGHISLQTKDFYASHWPYKSNGTSGWPFDGGNLGLYNAAAGVHPSNRIQQYNFYSNESGEKWTPEFDEIAEAHVLKFGRSKKEEPNLVIILYSLSAELMFKKFQQFLLSDKSHTWSLFGQNKIGQGPGESCSGLIYILLKAGGIDQLDFVYDRIRESTFTSPDNVAKLIISAELSDRKKACEAYGVTTLPNTILNVKYSFFAGAWSYVNVERKIMPIQTEPYDKKLRFDYNLHTNFIGRWFVGSSAIFACLDPNDCYSKCICKDPTNTWCKTHNEYHH